MTDIAFAASKRSTVGIEWELALIDRESGELRNEAEVILDRLGPSPGYPHTTGELLNNTVELVSAAHARVGDAVADLAAQLAQLRTVADPLGIELLSAGSHPFAKWQDQQVVGKDRYRKLIERTQWWGRNMMIWGAHVHVGVEDRSRVFPMLHALVALSPHLQALAASSPFWAGDVAGYASNRALVFQQLPTAGQAADLDDWAAFESYVSDLVRTGVIDEVTEVRWDVRPAPRWGTLEVRACDGLSTIEEVAGLTAYIQCLCEWFARRLDEGQTLPRLTPWFVRENKWRAARYGMDAEIILDNSGRESRVEDEILTTATLLEPIAADLGCLSELAWVPRIVERGPSYRRQLERYEHSGDLQAVALGLARELREGLR